MSLPAGFFETGDEYVTSCPSPSCSSRKFYWNVSRNVGHCKVCGLSIGGRKAFAKAFQLELDEEFSGPVQTKYTDTILHHPELWTANAWDHIPYRNFLMCRGLFERQVRELPIWWIPEERCMAIKTDPLSPELNPLHLIRYSPESKWIPPPGYAPGHHKLSHYGYGIEAWKARGSRNLILCEGIFDVLSPGLLGYAVAVFGTRLSNTWFAWLQQNVDVVSIMFDPEDENKAGMIAQAKLLDRLHTWGIKAGGVLAPKDPKNLIPGQMKDHAFLQTLKGWVDGGPLLVFQ